MSSDDKTHAPPDGTRGQFEERVLRAAAAALKRNHSVGPLELFQEMLLLQPAHVEGWRKGNPHFRVLEEHIQVGPKKFEQAIRYFQEWVNQQGLHPIEASYTRNTPRGIKELLVTADGNPEREKFYRTHYAAADLPEKRKASIAKKLKKAPDLVVFETVRKESQCGECGTELTQGDFLFMDKEEPLCLACADFDHLRFLAAGDAAMSRRARKHSPLSAVVVRFNRSRKRYERQGVLVTEEALAKAEKECAADAPERAAVRARAALARQEQDRQFVDALAQEILEQYPNCPADEAARIAAHTGLRSSGRVGRSAAGRTLDPRAVELAVRAHIRHEHTNYGKLLMEGTDRTDARSLVGKEIDRLTTDWARTE